MLVHEPVAGCGPKWLPLIKDGRVLFEKGRQPEPGMFVREAAYLSERARALENSGDEEKEASGDVDINAGQGQECKRRDIDGFKCFVNVVDMVCSGYFNGPVRRLDSEEAKEADAETLNRIANAAPKEGKGAEDEAKEQQLREEVRPDAANAVLMAEPI